MCPWEAPLQAAGCESLTLPVPGVQGMGTSGSLTGNQQIVIYTTDSILEGKERVWQMFPA